MNLYQINEAIENFEFEVDDETGEILNIDKLDGIKIERRDKIDNIACYIKNLKADAKGIGDEIAALQKRKKAKENRAASLASYLQKALGGEKFESSRCAVSYRKSTAVVFDDEDDFLAWCIANENDFYKSKMTITSDKVKVSKALKGGEELPYVHLEERNNIQIK